MPESYNKDAYEIIYKHKAWKETASNYEKNFARNLSRAPVVQDAARGALVKLSNMLNAYYGMQDKNKENAGQISLGGSYKMIADEKAMKEVAADVTGITPKITRTLEEALLPDMEQKDKDIDAEGYVSNAYQTYYNAAEGAFQNGSPMFLPKSLLQRAADDNQSNLENVINGDGSLEQRMWLIYNGVSNRGGKDANTASNSRTVQNMLRGMQNNDLQQIHGVGVLSKNQNLMQSNKNVDYESFRRLESESASGSEIFERAALERPSRKAAQKQGQSNAANHQQQAVTVQAPQNVTPQEEILQANEAGPSPKKKGRFSRAVSYLKQKLGFGSKKAPAPKTAAPPAFKTESVSVPKETPAVKSTPAPVRFEGSDIAHTTLKLLGAYRMLGAGKRDLLFFRLALISWLVRGKENSLKDILEASHKAGLKGSEDLSEAATMYTSLDPLTEQQLRAYAPDNRFPHETIYLTMLNEVKQERKGITSAKDKKAVMFHNLSPKDHPEEKEEYDALKYDAQEMAINLYTSSAYQVMNAGARGSDLNAAEEVLKNYDDAYLHSNWAERSDEDLMEKIFNVIRISSRMAQDALTVRGAELSDQKNEGMSEDREAVLAGDETQSSRGRAAYRGVTYRGGGIWKDLEKDEGSTFVTESLTSTTQDAEIAAIFYGRSPSENKAIVRYHLAGKGAVRVSDMSAYEGEAEVLLPIGTTLSIRHKLAPAYYQKGSIHQIKYEENLKPEEKAQIDSRLYSSFSDFEDMQFGEWVKVQMIDLEEVSGPGEQRRQQLEKGQNKNMKKAEELEKYRLSLKNRQAGIAS